MNRELLVQYLFHFPQNWFGKILLGGTNMSVCSKTITFQEEKIFLPCELTSRQRSNLYFAIIILSQHPLPLSSVALHCTRAFLLHLTDYCLHKNIPLGASTQAHEAKPRTLSLNLQQRSEDSDLWKSSRAIPPSEAA